MPEAGSSAGPGRRPLRRWIASWPTFVVLGVILATSLAIGSRSSSGPETVNRRVASLASGIRCPSCSGLSAEDSNASTAVAIRNAIRERVIAGQSNAQIDAYLVSRYGAGVLEQPPVSGVDALVWVVPLAAAGAAVAAAAAMFVLRRRRSAGGPTDADRLLVDQALEERSRAPAARGG